MIKRKNRRISKAFVALAVTLSLSLSTVPSVTQIGQIESASTIQGATKFSIKTVPKYKGNPSVQINNNKPYFTAKEKKNTKAFESYHKLDKLGRCGVAYANICHEIMPTEERGAIGQVKPTGWHTVKYNGVVDGNYLYNRCHLIAYCLAAENANKKNLITGTRYMNTEGMLPYEIKVAQYVEETGNHVLYRVTPIFKGENLLASGVLMEAYSVEDEGKGISFCVYAYNVQPGISINYKNGDSKLAEKENTNNTSTNKKNNQSTNKDTDKTSAKKTYIINTNTKKFHNPDCSSVKKMSVKNKKSVKDTRKNVISEGYDPCKICNP